jgi:hypothetical protein
MSLQVGLLSELHRIHTSYRKECPFPLTVPLLPRPAVLLDSDRALGNDYRHPVDWSGWPDLNRRPRAPKARALTRLRYTPHSDLIICSCRKRKRCYLDSPL